MNTYFSEVIYGGIDGVITTSSIVAGSAGGSLLKKVIIILGISNVISDGFSMGFSRYISSKTELEQGYLKNKNDLTSAFVTFLSFILIGVLPILPFLFLKGKLAKQVSFCISLIAFYTIGHFRGKILKKNKVYTGIHMVFIGMTAYLISFYVGNYISKFKID